MKEDSEIDDLSSQLIEEKERNSRLQAKLKAAEEALRRLDDGEVWNRGAAMAIVRAALQELRKP